MDLVSRLCYHRIVSSRDLCHSRRSSPPSHTNSLDTQCQILWFPECLGFAKCVVLLSSVERGSVKDVEKKPLAF